MMVLLSYILMAAAGIAASATIGSVLTNLTIGDFKTSNRVSHEQAS
jgi:hypothetical protein